MAVSRSVNFRLGEELTRVASEKAGLEGRTLTEVVREFLLEWVQSPPERPEPARIKTWKDAQQ